MKPEVNAYVMKQGLVLGCVFAVNFVITTIPSFAFISWGVEVLILWYVYKAGVKCREQIMEGEMSYGAGLWFTIQLFLYSSMVAGVIKYVYLKWLNTTYLLQLREAMEQTMEQMKLPAATMEETAKMMKEMFTPENMALYSVAGDVMLGVIVGLVMAAILKRNKI